jgi:ATP-dependent DNA helicase RecG
MEPGTEPYQRLERFVASGDGFQIAELDLELRGPGDLLGLRQSGVPAFRIANLLTDLSLILTAREYADRLLKNELSLSESERQSLKTYVKQQRERELTGGIS